MRTIESFLACESGASAIEYAFLLGFTTAVILAAIGLFGSQTLALFEYNAKSLVNFP